MENNSRRIYQTATGTGTSLVLTLDWASLPSGVPASVTGVRLYMVGLVTAATTQETVKVAVDGSPIMGWAHQYEFPPENLHGLDVRRAEGNVTVTVTGGNVARTLFLIAEWGQN